ncbi:MAG: DUF536 domain-containing protein [Streptococcaceae bacterium]|jgi:hypothetical protein|nr:DUF536 domain-containing protein [Streptococcaceae bacterium]
MNIKTVSELADLFGVSRQAMNNRVRALEADFVEENDRGFKVVNAAGVRELERLYGKVVTAEQEVVDKPKTAPPSEKSIVKRDKQDATIFGMLSGLMEGKDAEISRLTSQMDIKDDQIKMLGGQLSIKDHQIAEKDKQLDQQQQLTAAALADREEILLELKDVKKQQTKKRGFFGFGRKN